MHRASSRGVKLQTTPDDWPPWKFALTKYFVYFLKYIINFFVLSYLTLVVILFQEILPIESLRNRVMTALPNFSEPNLPLMETLTPI